mmetsp:Transcript_40992/g.98160  ORF Transcript_40992/g.98160 Transcript_40992/m.98160 type:complete len:172 (+) Transcript_40992:2329-2844(+)
MRAHVLFGMIMSLSLLIQLTPWIRKRNIKLHRLSGNILLVLFSVQAVPLFLHVWHLSLGWAAVWVELPLIPTGAYFGYRGYKQIKAGDVAGHRSSMIMMSPTFFFLGFGRLGVPIFEYVVVREDVRWTIGFRSDDVRWGRVHEQGVRFIIHYCVMDLLQCSRVQCLHCRPT